MRKEDPNFPEYEGKSEIIIGKQRNGPVGTVKLSFVKKWAQFENPADEENIVAF